MQQKTPPYSMQIFWSQEEESYVATCSEIEGASAFGATPQEAAAELANAIDGVVAVLQEDGEALPRVIERPKYSGQLRVRLPRSLHARLATEAEAEGVSLNTLIVSRLSTAPNSWREVRADLSSFFAPQKRLKTFVGLQLPHFGGTLMFGETREKQWPRPDARAANTTETPALRLVKEG